MAVAGRSSGRSQDIAFGKIAGDLQNAAFQFGAMVTAAQQLYQSLNVFRELEKQLTLTNAIANGTAETFTAMEKAVRDFALGVTFSAAESANALLFLSQAGFTATQSIQAMAGVLTLAQATLEDVNETADLVASTITSFSLNAEDATKVANLFAASMNQSLASLPKLAFALRQVGPVAASMGVTLEDTTAALSELFNVGLRGEQAGTALRNVLVNLVSPAGEAAKVLKTLGLNVYDTQGRMRDLFSILKDLARYDLSDTDLAALFGREALAGGTALLQSAASGSLDEMRDKTKDTQDAVRVALEQAKSFDSALKMAANGIDEFRISIGGWLAEGATPLLHGISDMAIAFRELDQPTKDYVFTLGSLSIAAAAGIPILLKLGGIFGSVVGGITRYAGTLANSVTAIQDVYRATNAPTSANAGLSSTLGRLGAAAAAATPLILGVSGAILGIGGLVYAFTEARAAYDQAKFEEVFGSFEEFADTIDRSFQNFRQINSANKGGADYLKGFVATVEGSRQIIEDQQNNIKDLRERAKTITTLQQDLLSDLTRDPTETLNVPEGKSLDEVLRDVLGVRLSENRVDLEAGKKNVADYANARAKLISEALGGINKQFQEDFNKAFQEQFDARTPFELAVRNPDQGIRNISQQLSGIVQRLFGQSSAEGIQAEIENQIKKMNEDITKSNSAIGDAFTRVEKLDLSLLVQNMQTALTADFNASGKAEIGGLAKGANTVNDRFIAYVKDLLAKSVEGQDVTKDLNDLTTYYRDLLVNNNVITSDQLAKALATAERTRTTIVLKETFDKVADFQRQAEDDLIKARRTEAAAKGDKEAEKLLREAEETSKLINRIMDEADKLATGFSRPFENRAGVSQDMISVLTGGFIADALQAGGDRKSEAVKALQDAEAFQKYAADEWQRLAELGQFEEVLNRKGLNSPDLDVDALFGNARALLQALEEGQGVSDEVNAAMNNLIKYFAANNEQALLVIEAAGIPIDTLASADIPKVAAGVFMADWANQMANALATMNTGSKLREAFLKSADLIDFASKGVDILIEDGKALIDKVRNFNGGAFGEASAAADDVVKANDTAYQNAIKGDASRKKLLALLEGSQSALSGANARTDKRGSGGKNKKTQAEVLAELEAFLAERNEKIIQANLDLAAFGGDFDIADMISLRQQQVSADFERQIADLKEAYEKMFADVAKGSDSYNRLQESRDRELEQLTKLRDANIEYANSAEFAARVAVESQQAILDKYIEMNTYTGSFAEGIFAGMQQHLLDAQTEFQTGMDVFKELIDGTVSFGTSMFNDYFTKVATGQEKFSDVLRQNLAKQLLSWGSYFAELAMKYAADFALKQIMGIFNGGLGSGTGSGLNFFPSAPTKSGGLFAKGGVTTGTQYFGYKDEVQVGTRGEAGTEGTFPLTRDKQGRLAVIGVNPKGSSSSPSGGNVLNYNPSYRFDLGDSNVSQEQGRAFTEGLDEKVQQLILQTITYEKREGGMLYTGRR